MATRSAMRAGWLTGRVMFMIAEPTWMRCVLAMQYAMNDSEAERCEYSSRKWCSADQEYLNPTRSASWMYSSSFFRVSCSVRTFPSRQCFGWYMFVKMPNSITASAAGDSRSNAP